MASGILFVENYIAGGSDQVARTLIHYIPFDRLAVYVNRANDTSVLLSGSLPPHVRVHSYGLITVAELSTFANSCNSAPVRFLVRALGVLVRYPLIAFSVLYFWCKFRHDRPDIFIANNGGYPGGDYCRSAAIAASLLSGTRVFHLVHSMARPPRAVLAPFEWIMDRLTDRRCKLVADCRAIADRLRECRAITQDISVIHNGVPDARPKDYPTRQDRTVHLLHVGYFNGVKNQSMLLRAVGGLIQRGYTNVLLHFVGKEAEVGYFDSCRRLAVELGIQHNVVFEGFVADIEKYYYQCDIFVLCSTVEGFPLSVIEAMRAGMPVVATHVGGLSELIVNGITGFLVEPHDAKSLEEQIGAFLADPTLIEALGKEGRKRFLDYFTVSNMAQRYASLFGLSQIASL